MDTENYRGNGSNFVKGREFNAGSLNIRVARKFQKRTRQFNFQADLSYLGQRFRITRASEEAAKAEVISLAREQFEFRAVQAVQALPKTATFRRSRALSVPLLRDGLETLQIHQDGPSIMKTQLERLNAIDRVLARHSGPIQRIGIPDPNVLAAWARIQPAYHELKHTYRACLKRMEGGDLGEGSELTFTIGQVARERGVTKKRLSEMIEKGDFPVPLLMIRRSDPGKTERHFSSLQYAAINTGYGPQLTVRDFTPELYWLMRASVIGVIDHLKTKLNE